VIAAASWAAGGVSVFATAVMPFAGVTVWCVRDDAHVVAGAALKDIRDGEMPITSVTRRA
jgi:hypothetical protein